MTGLLGAAAGALALLSVVAALAVLVATARPRAAVGVLLDLFLAAGLLRLVAVDDWSSVAGVAALVVVRRLAVSGVGAPPPGQRSLSSSDTASWGA